MTRNSLETLISDEGNDLNLHNTLTLFTVLCLETSQNQPPLPQHLLWSLAGEGIYRGVAQASLRVSFPGRLHVHGRYAYQQTFVVLVLVF